MNLILKHTILAIFAIILVGLTVFVPAQIRSKEDFGNLRFGFPITYVSQDFSAYEYNSNFKYQRFELFLGDAPIKNFSIVKFIASFFLVFLFIEALIWILETIAFNVRKFFKKDKWQT